MGITHLSFSPGLRDNPGRGGETVRARGRRGSQAKQHLLVLAEQLCS